MKKLALVVVIVFLQFLSYSNYISARKPGRGMTEAIQKAILIGWDGAQREHVKECLDKGELPNLKRLVDEGSFIGIYISGVTETKPGWAEILTGYKADITGVYSNSNYGPIPQGYTIFERLEDYFGADKFVTVAVIAKNENMSAGPPVEKLNSNEGTGFKSSITQAKPFYHAQNSIDLFSSGLMADKRVGDRAIDLLGKYKNRAFFFFVHFGSPDYKGHMYGENSREYNDALISCDIRLGKIMEELQRLNIYDKTFIYVTADHGFDEGKNTHRRADTVFLATNDPVLNEGIGSRADIAPTILYRFGVPLEKIRPPLSGEPLIKTGSDTISFVDIDIY